MHCHLGEARAIAEQTADENKIADVVHRGHSVVTGCRDKPLAFDVEHGVVPDQECPDAFLPGHGERGVDFIASSGREHGEAKAQGICCRLGMFLV